MIRRSLRTLSVLAVLLSLSVLTMSGIALADNRWPLHWKQNPGGGYDRWVPYVDQTNPSIYGSYWDHVASHYYYADDHIYPYEACSGCGGNIVGKSYYYNASWWGLTQVLSDDGTHQFAVDVHLDEADSLTGSQIHSLICHELGHAVGLAHRSLPDWSCLRSGDVWPEDFDAHDTSTLWNYYYHTD